MPSSRKPARVDEDVIAFDEALARLSADVPKSCKVAMLTWCIANGKPFRRWLMEQIQREKIWTPADVQEVRSSRRQKAR